MSGKFFTTYITDIKIIQNTIFIISLKRIYDSELAPKSSTNISSVDSCIIIMRAQVSDKSRLTQMYIATYPNKDTMVYLEDLPTRQSSPFRRLSSTIRSHQNDCGRLRDYVSACGMRYRNYRLSCRHLIDSRLPPCYDDCTCTGNTEISRLTYEFDAIVPMTT